MTQMVRIYEMGRKRKKTETRQEQGSIEFHSEIFKNFITTIPKILIDYRNI